MCFFSDSQYGFRFSQSTANFLTVIGFLTGLGLLELQHLIYYRLLAGFGMLFFVTKLSLMEFQVIYLLSNRHRQVVLDGKSSQDSLDNARGLKVLFFVLYFSYYTSMTFTCPMILSEIMLSTMIILLSILGLIRHLISGNNWI